MVEYRKILEPCKCQLCVTRVSEEPIHPDVVAYIPIPPPKGTLQRAIWDARGGPPPIEPQTYA